MKKIFFLLICLCPFILMAQITPTKINIKVGSGTGGGTINTDKLINTVAKNATKDSIIITLNDGTRFAVKDSVGVGGSAAWGSITGTLSSQTDLNTALGLKLNSADFNSTFDTRLGTKSTTNLPEGTNLYWTNARGDARYPQLSGAYSNPSWITGLAWSKITSAPSFVTLPQLGDSLANYVKKDSTAPLGADSHIKIVQDGDTTRVTLDNIDGIAAGGDLSGTYSNPTVAKLNGQLPSYYLSRANHTGAQAASTISDFTTASQTVGDARYVKLTDSSKFLRKEDSGKYVTPTAFANGLAAVKPAKFTGVEYYKYSGWSNLNDFTDNTMSATVNDGNILIPDANVSDFTKYLTLDSVTCVNHWKMVMLFKRTANPGGGGAGISLGIKSINSNSDCSNAVYFAGAGTLQYFYNSNGGGWGTGIGGTSSALTYSNGDTIRLVIQRDNQHISMSVENMTNASAVARQIDIDIPITTGPVIPNTGRWTIFAQGGSFQVISLKCVNNEVKTPNVLVVGDSKTMGFGATNYDSTVTGQLKKLYNGVAVSGGFGDKISDMLKRLPQLLAMHAKVVVLNSLGSNDIRFGRSVSDAMTDYATLRQAFIDDGSTVIDVSPCYEASQSLSALYAAWKTAYGSLPTSVDIFKVPQQYGLYGDSIHDGDATQKEWSKRLAELNIIEGAKSY